MSEAFTILAILEAKNRASETIAQVNESLDKFSETAGKAAEAAKGAGTSIDESLLQTASGADALELASARTAAAQEKATRTAEAQADAERNLLEVHKAAATAADDDVAAQYRLMEAEQRMSAAARENAAAQKELGTAEKLQSDTAAAAAAKTDAAAASQARLSDVAKASGISLGAVGKIAGITAAGMGIAGALMVRAAGNFQDSTAHLQTDAGVTAQNLGMVRAGILQVSTATGTSASAITDAMYHIASSGFRAANGLAILKTVAEGAKVGGADLDTTSKALVGTLTAYYGTSMTAAQATQRSTALMNQLIVTVGSGDMRMQDLASSLSAVTPVAAAAHVQFAEVGGAVATMTAQGMSANQATQNLAHAIRSLSSPNNVAIQEMNQLGINANDVSQHLGQRGLTGTIGMLTKAITDHMGKSGQVILSAFNQSTTAGQALKTMLGTMPPQFKAMAEGLMNGTVSAKQWRTELQSQTPVNAHLLSQFATLYEKSHSFSSILAAGGPAAQTYTAALSKMMGGATGLNVALMLSGQNASVFAGNVKAIADAARKGGSQVENWSTIQGTFNFKMSQAKVGLENTGIAIGTALLPAATALMSAIGKILIPIAEWTTRHRTLTLILFAGVAAVAATIAILVAAAKAYKAVTGAVDTMKTAYKDLSKLFGKAAADQAASAEAGAAATEEAAAESAAAEDEAAAESSGSWLASFARTAAGAVASAARTVAAWAATGAQMVAQAAIWVASNTAKVAVVVAENVMGALATAAAWMIANAAMLLGIGLIVVAIAAAVYLIVTHWKQISAFAKAAFDEVLHIVESVIDWVTSHWPLLLAIITGPIGLAVLWIVDHWRLITDAVARAISWVKSHWPLILAILTGPIGLAVLAIIKYWHDITDAVARALDWVRSHWPLILAIITGPIGLAALFVIKHWDQITAGAQHMIADLVGFFERLPGRILSAVGDLGHLLWNAGISIINGLISGIEAAVPGLHSALSWVSSLIPSWKGPLDKDGRMLVPHGTAIMQGLMKGIASQLPALRSQLAGVSGTIRGSATAGVSLSASSPALAAIPAGGAGGAGTVIQIDLRGAQVMSDRDMDNLVSKVGTAVATRILPQAGVRVRF